MSKIKVAVLCPGQGAQHVGMGRSAWEHKAGKAVFDQVDDALGYKLSDLILQGNESDLKQTQHAQPALMTVSMALYRVLCAEGFDPAWVAGVAGHSLGEVTALCLADVLSVADAARLLQARGRAMADACPNGGGMAAILGLKPDLFQNLPTFSAGLCVLANDNGAGQVVLSGHQAALEQAKDWVKEQGGRFIPLPVSGPFHSPLMQPAADALANLLAEQTFQAPRVPVYTNVSATPQTDPAVLKDHLLQQITGRVRWRETMTVLQDTVDATHVLEIGAGKVLTGLWTRQGCQPRCTNLQNVEDGIAFLKTIKEETSYAS